MASEDTLPDAGNEEEESSDDGILDAKKMQKIAADLAGRIPGRMPCLMRIIVSALTTEYTTRMECTLTLLRELQAIEYFKRNPEDVEFVVILIMEHLDDFYTALRLNSGRADDFPTKLFLRLKAEEGNPAHKKYAPKAPLPSTIIDALPKRCHERVRTLLELMPLPTTYETTARISDAQRKALAEICGLLFANGGGRLVSKLTGIRADMARTLLVKEELTPHHRLPQLREEIVRRAEQRRADKKRLSDSTRRLIIAYTRLDAEVGGTAFKQLSEMFKMTADSITNWAKEFIDVPTQDLLADLPEPA